MPGPYYFCYIDEPEPFDPDVHNVEDEAIILAKISQDEGAFASLEIDVINPREGLLAPGRKPWCWFSWDNGISIVPLFTGRLVAVPAQMDGETVRLLFIAKPPDFENIKADLADSMKVLPFWDPVWIAGDLDDPDAVLKTYGARWHIDRATLELGISDELVPEDGTIELTAAEVLYGSVGQTYTQKPKLKGKFRGTLTWSQTGKGTIDLSERIYQKFREDRSIYRNPGSHVISTLTGEGLKGDWPKGGASLGGGWTVNVDTSIEEASETNFARYTYDVPYQGISPSWDASNEATQFAWLDALTDYIVRFPVAALKESALFDWSADRKRTEILEFTMLADVQPLESDDSDTESTITITVSAADTVTEPDPITGVMPIIDKRRKAYLPTDRGAISVWYPLLLVRAGLRLGARAIEHKLRTPWAIGILATLRKSILFPDGRLAGGAVSGKITSYSFVASAADGFYCDFTLGSAVGRGGTVSAASGTGTYAAPGYMGPGYQVVTGAQESVPGLETELVYQSLTDAVAFPIDDDGVDLQTMDEFTAVESLTLTGGLATQINAVTAAFDPITALKDYPSVLCLQLKPVAEQDPFETVFSIAVERLPIPQGIDLEVSA